MALFKKAATYGDLYVGVGSDESVRKHKHEPFWTQEERLYMVSAVRYVKEAMINKGMGFVDYTDNPLFMECDILILNKERLSERVIGLCREAGKEYYVFNRIHAPGLPVRSSTEIRGYGNNSY